MTSFIGPRKSGRQALLKGESPEFSREGGRIPKSNYRIEFNFEGTLSGDLLSQMNEKSSKQFY